jgi:hypothetical protein
VNHSALVVGGLATFQGLLINQAFGFSVADSQLLQMPLGNFQMILYMSSAYLAHRYRQVSGVTPGATQPKPKVQVLFSNSLADCVA